MNKTTLMIIDDHASFPATWLSVLANNERYEVIDKTDNSEIAIELIQDKRPDIVLVDTNVRPLDGFKVLRQIRKSFPEIKVIGLSVHSQPIYAKRMMREGARAFITKASASEEFIHAVNEVVQGHQYICKQTKDTLAEQVLNSQKPTGFQSLSKRELEIIRYIRDEIGGREIAGILSISPKTVEVHRHNILKKLGVKNTPELIQTIKEHGI